MRTVTVLLIALALLLSLAACRSPLNNGDDEPPANGTPDQPDPEPELLIYAAGYYEDGTADVAAYWVIPGGAGEIERVALTHGVPSGADARARGVFVVGEDVYVAGYYIDELDNSVPVYWLNGVATELVGASGPVGVAATGVVVEAGVVYVSGLEEWPAPQVPVYWRGGVVNELLTPPAENAAATGIAASGGTAIISGYYNNGTTGYAAALWRQQAGEAVETVDLSGAVISEALAVHIGADGTYYVAGTHTSAADVLDYTAAYWVIDPVDLSSTRTTLDGVSRRAFGITTVNGEVYTAGYYADSGDRPAYWVGDQRSDLPSGSGGRALDVAVDAGVVYAAGYSVESGVRTAVLWLDDGQGGVEVRVLPVPDQDASASEAWSIRAVWR